MNLGFRAQFSLIKDSIESPVFSVKGEPWSIEGVCKIVHYHIDVVSDFKGLKDSDNIDSILVCGQVTNQDYLQDILYSREKLSITSTEELITTVFELYGLSGFSLFEGLLVAAFISKSGSIQVFSSKTAGPSIYYHYDKSLHQLTVATELKAFPKTLRKVRTYESFVSDLLIERKIKTMLENVYRVPAGYALNVDLDSGKDPVLSQYYSELRSVCLFDEKESAQRIQTALKETIFSYSGKSASCLISGGLDSSIVAYLAKERFSELNLFSIGTESSNEFEYAKVFAKSIGKDFDKIVIDEKEFINKLPNLLWLTEHPFSMFNEYLVPVHIAYEKINIKTDIMLSGYGSDVLFAGFAKPSDSLTKVANLIHSEYETTLWSNEASQTLGGHHGFNVAYPFFDSEVVDLSFSIDPYLKHKGGIEKYILRKAFEGQITDNVLSRKKVGIHEGSGCEDFFTHRLNDLGIYNNIRFEKDRYCYHILKMLLEEAYLPNAEEIIAEADHVFLDNMH